MSSKAKTQVLAAKEAKLFKELLRDFEDRAYKKGLKTADAILKKNPDNGETLCMRGIIQYNVGRKQEGLELVQKGTKLNPNSHICWHVSALVYRAEKDQEKALECYTQAVKIEKDQVAITRDLISLQLQLRRLPDTLEHRIHLALLQPKIRTSWLGLAVAYHLNKQYKDALSVLDKFEEMQTDIPRRDYEYSELVLYHATVLEESGDASAAYAYLEKNEQHVVDRLELSSAKARLSTKTGNSKSAELTYRALLNDHPDNHSFIEGYLKARGGSLAPESEEQATASLQILDELFQGVPRSLAVRRLMLQVSSGDVFKKRVNTYLIEFLTKGVPSLFVDLKALYSDDSKRQIIESLVEGYKANLEKTGTLDGAPVDGDVDPPTTTVWVLHFLAQHYSHMHRHVLALELINKVIEHTPTLPDLLMMKARILKRAGDPVQAEQAMESARLLDGQDRFLNGKACKYKLRVDQIEAAEKTAGLFTRKDAKSPLTDLIDMQGLWFLIEEAESYKRQGKTALALKRLHQISKVFSDYRDDEYDFHSWCLRKSTLRAYINLIRFEDRLWAHPMYLRAAKLAVEIYLSLNDKPKSNGTTSQDDDNADEERRKALKKAKKAQAKAKAAQQDTKKQAPSVPIKASDEDPAEPADEDPSGEKLAATESPLEEGYKFVLPLESMAADKIDTWLLSFDIHFAKKSFLRCIKALRQAHAVQPDNAQLYTRLAKFNQVASASPAVLSETESKLYNAVKETLFPWPSLEAGNAAVLQKHASSPEHLVAVALSSAKEQQEELLFQLFRDEFEPNLKVVQQALQLLQSAESARVQEFKKLASTKFPLASVFQDAATSTPVSAPSESKEELDI